MTDFLLKRNMTQEQAGERDAQGRYGEKVWSVLPHLLAYYPSQICMCSPASNFLGFNEDFITKGNWLSYRSLAINSICISSPTPDVRGWDWKFQFSDHMVGVLGN